MSYSIDEHNLERQRLLAKILNPFTRGHLDRLTPKPDGRWLDVGSGLGETTRMLAEYQTPAGTCVGLEQDTALIDVARSQDWGTHDVTFQEGDAHALPFDDDWFDFVFTRFVLVHLPDPVTAVREMLRVVRPGGIVLAHESDFSFTCCYPPSPAYERLPALLSKAFADFQVGRKLVHYFRAAGVDAPDVKVDAGLESDGTDYKTLYRMTFEAMTPGLVEAGGRRRSLGDAG